jgi:hypothetical protein
MPSSRDQPSGIVLSITLQVGNCTRMAWEGEGQATRTGIAFSSIGQLLSTKYLLETHLAQ